MTERDAQSDLFASILQYLSDHEQAADTVAGIEEFWVGPRARPLAAGAVARALVDLVHAGILEQRELPDGTVIYRRAVRPIGEET